MVLLLLGCKPAAYYYAIKTSTKFRRKKGVDAERCGTFQYSEVEKNLQPKETLQVYYVLSNEAKVFGNLLYTCKAQQFVCNYYFSSGFKILDFKLIKNWSEL